MLQHRSMHAATVGRAERVSRACSWCARRAQSLLSNWSSRAQFYGFMPNFPTALRLLVVLWHTVAMDAQHTHQGKEDFQQHSGWKMLKLAQCFFNCTSRWLKTKFETPNVRQCFFQNGYGRAAYTPGERRLPAAASNGQWMENAKTCPMFLLLHQPVTKNLIWNMKCASKFVFFWVGNSKREEIVWFFIVLNCDKKKELWLT